MYVVQQWAQLKKLHLVINVTKSFLVFHWKPSTLVQTTALIPIWCIPNKIILLIFKSEYKKRSTWFKTQNQTNPNPNKLRIWP